MLPPGTAERASGGWRRTPGPPATPTVPTRALATRVAGHTPRRGRLGRGGHVLEPRPRRKWAGPSPCGRPVPITASAPAGPPPPEGGTKARGVCPGPRAGNYAEGLAAERARRPSPRAPAPIKPGGGSRPRPHTSQWSPTHRRLGDRSRPELDVRATRELPASRGPRWATAERRPHRDTAACRPGPPSPTGAPQALILPLCLVYCLHISQRLAQGEQTSSGGSS